MLITVPEVCDRLKISKHTCYRLLHNGTMPALRVSHGRHRYLIDTEVVDKLAQQEDFYGVPLETGASAGSAELMTASEVATVLRCAVETVRRLASIGVLPAVRNPGKNSHWRFRRQDVDAYLYQPNSAVSEA